MWAKFLNNKCERGTETRVEHIDHPVCIENDNYFSKYYAG